MRQWVLCCGYYCACHDCNHAVGWKCTVTTAYVRGRSDCVASHQASMQFLFYYISLHFFCFDNVVDVAVVLLRFKMTNLHQEGRKSTQANVCSMQNGRANTNCSAYIYIAAVLVVFLYFHFSVFRISLKFNDIDLHTSSKKLHITECISSFTHSYTWIYMMVDDVCCADALDCCWSDQKLCHKINFRIFPHQPEHKNSINSFINRTWILRNTNGKRWTDKNQRKTNISEQYMEFLQLL